MCRLTFAPADAPIAILFLIGHRWRRAAERHATCIEDSRASPQNPSTKLNTHTSDSVRSSNPVNPVNPVKEHTPLIFLFVLRYLRYLLLNAVFVSFTNQLDHSLPPTGHWSLITGY